MTLGLPSKLKMPKDPYMVIDFIEKNLRDPELLVWIDLKMNVSMGMFAHACISRKSWLAKVINATAASISLVETLHLCL